MNLKKQNKASVHPFITSTHFIHTGVTGIAAAYPNYYKVKVGQPLTDHWLMEGPGQNYVFPLLKFEKDKL